MSGFLISIIRPQGYLHSDAFREVAESLQFGLRRLGHAAAIFENVVDPSATNIILGAHLLNEEDQQALPEQSIIYNLEQLGAPHLGVGYYRLAERYRIWDYSPINVQRWNQLTCAHPVRLVEVGYVPELCRIAPAAVQDIDVLFYGSMTEPRMAVLRQLEQAGVRVHAAFGVYGKERDALIARAKIVLNLHCYETQLFEVVRVSYLLANSKAVISETSPDIGDFEHAVIAVPYGLIVQSCLGLLQEERRRRLLESQGSAFFQQREMGHILERSLRATAEIAGDKQETRRLYLDMVQRCLINVIYEDPNQDRWSPHEYHSRLRELGRDWPSQAHSMIGKLRMANLRWVVEQVIQQQIPGDLIETGVWRGGACILMRAVLKAYGVTDRRVWVADSFCGLPAPVPGVEADAGDQHHTFPELAISLEEVKANFAKYDLLDQQVRFLPGWFSETLPDAPIKELAVLRLDGDMYSSTMDALAGLYDKVAIGGFVIVDDFGAVPGCRKAVQDFRRDRGIEDAIQDIDGLGVYWRKSGSEIRTHLQPQAQAVAAQSVL
jgi:O-methyltransferase/8-demethyl-8-(2,3-dimethoxy-alpha-L-rhamnosyl)tetracenomycin-C 4'-O-methyltransferase